MAKPGRDGKYVGETVPVGDTVWIWTGSSWADANVEESDAIPFDDRRFDE